MEIKEQAPQTFFICSSIPTFPITEDKYPKRKKKNDEECRAYQSSTHFPLYNAWDSVSYVFIVLGKASVRSF